MKNARHQLILKLINENEIETQEELANLLNENGFAVTQATVSRDIRQLQLQKTHYDNGKQRYVLSSESGVDFRLKYNRALKDAYVSVSFSGNIMVLKTVSGMAMAAAAALDSFDWPELLGCIGGDDTIICVLRSEKDQEKIFSKIREIIE